MQCNSSGHLTCLMSCERAAWPTPSGMGLALRLSAAEHDSWMILLMILGR